MGELHNLNGLLWSLAIASGALIVGTIIRLLSVRNAEPSVVRQRLGSLVVWWVLLLLLSVAVFIGKVGIALLCLAAGLVAFREFDGLLRVRQNAAAALAWITMTIGVMHYMILAFTSWSWSIAAFPLITLLLLCTAQMVLGGPQDYLRTTGGYLWGAVLLFLGISHVLLLMRLPALEGFGDMGWVLYVLLLTEVDDIAQALVGRKLGRRKIIPGISPGKSWEGLIGGGVVTIVLSCSVAPWLMSFGIQRGPMENLVIAAGAGAVLAVAGFLGDINMSALKREAGAKDSGTLLPGMGGMIDRVDSLTLTAPAIYYYGLLWGNA